MRSKLCVAIVAFATVLVALLLSERAAFAFGETFRIGTSGTEYCGHFDFGKFNSRNAIPLWVRIDDETQLTVSLTSDFQPGTTFPLSGYYYLTASNAASFVGGVVLEDGAYATIQGKASLDRRTGVVTKLSGVFIQNSVIFAGCFSSGKFKSVKN